MAHNIAWHFHGFPEEIWMGTDNHISPALRISLNHLQTGLRQPHSSTFTLSSSVKALTLQIDVAESVWQRTRGQYLLARALLRLEQWSEARAILSHIELPPHYDPITPVLIARAQALAANQDHHFLEAIAHYRTILSHWQPIAKAGQAHHYLQEDADAFTCDIYRQMAQAWFYLGSVETARKVLEQEALPLVETYFPQLPTPLAEEATRQSECNWRLLRLYIPWMLGECVLWQERLADEPSVYDGDLGEAQDRVQAAVNLSQIMPEGRTWTSAMLTAEAEMLTQRSFSTEIPDLREILCNTARVLLQSLRPRHQTQQPTKIEILYGLVHSLAQAELTFAECLAQGTLQRTDEIIITVDSLQAQAQGEKDAAYKFFTASCLLLKGRIAAVRQSCDMPSEMAAIHYYFAALKSLPDHHEHGCLLELAIRAEIRKLR